MRSEAAEPEWEEGGRRQARAVVKTALEHLSDKEANWLFKEKISPKNLEN